MQPPVSGAPYYDLLKRDKTNLDIFWLRDESLGNSSDLPDPAILAAEIVGDLQATLDQFAQIAADLAASGRNGERS
jgi:type I restriction enzyme M protein